MAADNELHDDTISLNECMDELKAFHQVFDNVASTNNEALKKFEAEERHLVHENSRKIAEMETRAGQFVRDLGDRDRGLEELHTTVSSLCKTIEVLLTKSAPLISSSKISNRERRNKTGNDMDDQQLVKHTTVGRPIGGETDGTRQHYDDDRGQRCSAVRSQRCNDVRSQPCNDDRSQPCNDDRGKEPARNTQRRSRSRSEKASGLPLVTTGSHGYKRRVTPDASDNRLTPRRTRAGQLSTPGLVVTGEHQVNVAKTTVAVASRTDVRTDTQ